MDADATALDQSATALVMERFVGKFRLLDERGLDGLFEQLPLWLEQKEGLTSDQFARCQAAIGLNHFEIEMMDAVAQRLAQARAIPLEHLKQCALLAALTIFGDQLFKALVSRAQQMVELSASELLESVMKAPLHHRVEDGWVYNERYCLRPDKASDE